MSSPRLDIDLQKIHHNASTLVRRLAGYGISVTGVMKAALGSPDVAKALLSAGVKTLADSRIQNVERMRDAHISAQIMLIRSPMLSQITRIVAQTDISFNTELDVINALSTAAKKTGRTHGIVLMVELGDLREGLMPEDVERMVRKTRELPNIKFMGLGANLACRSGVCPDTKNMGELSTLANSIDATFGFKMDIVSGGNSANLEWVFSGSPTGRINHLRLGEAILLGLNPLDRQPIDGLYTDACKLIAEVIEVKVKPTQPWGRIAQAAYGTPPPVMLSGIGTQILLALGEQDTDTAGLTPPAGMSMLSASSDHLVLNPGSHCLSIGDEVELRINYSALARAVISPFIAMTKKQGRNIAPCTI